MRVTFIWEYQTPIKTHDQGQDHRIKRVVPFVSLWWEDIDVEEGCWTLVSKGRTRKCKVGDGDRRGEKDAEGHEERGESDCGTRKGVLGEWGKSSTQSAQSFKQSLSIQVSIRVNVLKFSNSNV